MITFKRAGQVMFQRRQMEIAFVSILWIHLLFVFITTWTNRNPDRNWDKASAHSFSAEALFSGWYKTDWMPSAIGTYIWPLPDMVIKFFEFRFNPSLGNGLFTAGLVAITINLLFKISTLILGQIGDSRLHLHLSIVISVLAPFWLGELGTTFVDWISAPFVLGALMYLLRICRGQYENKNLYFLGINLGFSLALKLTNGVFLIATLFCMLLIVFINHQEQKIRTLYRVGIGVFAGISPIFPWWFFVYRETGNPIFPFYNGIFMSPHYPSINYKDTRWDWTIPESLLNIPTGWIMGTPVSELKSIDVRLIFLVGLYAAISGMLLIRHVVKTYLAKELELISKSAINRPRNTFSVAFIFHAWILCATLSWIFMFGIGRYWIAVELLVGIAIAHLALSLFSSRHLSLIFLASIFLIVSIMISPPNWNDSARSGLGTAKNPWESQLTSRISGVSGMLITEGSPLSFLRTTNRKISSMVGLNLPNIPVRFTSEAIKILESNQILYYVTTNPKLYRSVPESVSQFLGTSENLEITCELLEGPILVTYQYCEIQQKPSL